MTYFKCKGINKDKQNSCLKIKTKTNIKMNRKLSKVENDFHFKIEYEYVHRILEKNFFKIKYRFIYVHGTDSILFVSFLLSSKEINASLFTFPKNISWFSFLIRCLSTYFFNTFSPNKQLKQPLNIISSIAAFSVPFNFVLLPF